MLRSADFATLATTTSAPSYVQSPGMLARSVIAMSRWQKIVDDVLTDLETLAPDSKRFRIDIDEKIYEGEMLAAHAESATPDETPKQRRQDFLTALHQALRDREPRVWKEALYLLDNPRIRVSDDIRPSLK